MALTQLTPGGWGGGLYGSFAGRSPAPPPAPTLVLLGGGPGEEYHRRHKSYGELREDSIQQRLAGARLELKRIDEKIAEDEARRLAAQKRAKAKLLADKAAKKLVALEATLQEDINRLRMERVWLMRLIDDEEAVLVLLLSWPLH